MEDGSSISYLLTAVEQPVSSETPLFLNLVILFILILINAFFSATEIAVITLNDNKVKKKAEEGDKIARQLVRLISKPGNFLATIQVEIGRAHV